MRPAHQRWYQVSISPPKPTPTGGSGREDGNNQNHGPETRKESDYERGRRTRIERNRAAARRFRDRRENYIKTLEEKAAYFKQLEKKVADFEQQISELLNDQPSWGNAQQQELALILDEMSTYLPPLVAEYVALCNA